MRIAFLTAALLAFAGTQAPSVPDWSRVEAETIKHFQALLRFDTADPPGQEADAAAYLKQVLEAEGIPVETFALEPKRPTIPASSPTAS